MSAAKPLTGINILVTRPAHQANELAGKIRALGGNPILFPVLEITDVKDPQPLLALIERLEQFDLAIFISPNAVDKAMCLINNKRTLPPNLKVVAVGKGSANALLRFGVSKVIAPTDHYDSEALLDKVELQQVEGRHVVIFRGNGGRKLLGDTLIKRGAVLEYAECYHRGKPDLDPTELLAVWSHNKLNAVTITSSEGLYNLFDMVGKFGKHLLEVTPLFTVHERISQTAKDLGLTVVMTTSAGDEGLLRGLLDYFQAINAEAK